MLDRSIPFYNTILRCDKYNESQILLPAEYSFQHYREGYEDAWARLEYEIGDFDSVEEARQYFIENYLCDKGELVNRAVFLTDMDGNVIGTCLAWKDMKEGKEVSSLHWLSVSPKHQGKGLGRTLCQKVMQIFKEENGLPVYIHTQPWSWKAILLYISLGFKLQKVDTFSHYENQYDCVMSTLKKVVSEAQYETILENSAEN